MRGSRYEPSLWESFLMYFGLAVVAGGGIMLIGLAVADFLDGC